MAAGTAAAGIRPVAEEAVIAGLGVHQLPAAAVSLAPVIGADIKVITLGIYETDAAANLFSAVKPLGGAGIADMLAKPEEAEITPVAEVVVLAAFSRQGAGA